MQLVEKVRPMTSYILGSIRILVLAVVAIVLLTPQANAFRILKVGGASEGDKSPVVKYIYPTGFSQDEPLDFRVRERSRRPVIINKVSACNCPHVTVNISLRHWHRYRGIRVHRAGVFHRSRIRLHRAGQFGY